VVIRANQPCFRGFQRSALTSGRAFHKIRGMLKRLAILLLTFACIAAQAESRPRIRAITAFVKIDRTNYKSQLADANKMLQSAKKEFVNAGYQVQTVRITTQPFPQYVKGMSEADALSFLNTLDKLAGEGDYAFNIGPATMTEDVASFPLLAQFLAHAQHTNSSAIVAGDDGLHWNAIYASARLIKYLEDNSPHSQGNFSFTPTAFLPAYAPFFPGSWHDGPGHKFAIGWEGANMVQAAFAPTHDHTMPADRLNAAFAREGKAVEAIATHVAKSSSWEYLGLDPTPAPLKDVSIGAAIESYTGHPLGSSGTLTAAFVITSAVQAVPVKQIGYRGLMLPVMEDARIAQRWSEGKINLDSLLSYSSVCGTGLDTIPLPVDVTKEQLARIIGDMATLALKWKKPLTARLQPVKGGKVGDMSNFDGPYLVNAKIQPLP
jgi:uncharacterized protein (UPF0210 family)